MQYAYAYQLNGSQAGGFDPDAKAYILAVEAAGATVTSTQKKAINTFYKTGKANGWYSSLKRIYLPIWAIASANARCMVSGTSGTFNGAVTHSVGYVQGNGSTGYFNFGVSPSTLNLSNSGGGLFALVYITPTSSHTHIGALTNSTNSYLAILSTATQYRAVPFASARQQLVTESFANMSGVLFMDRDGGDDVYYSRKTAGLTEIARTTQAASGSAPTHNLFAMALNNAGSVSAPYSNAGYGVWGVTENNSQASAFTLAIKNLWEGCTGLTLP
jgi:roadblock/LC7 domain-containing protein